MVDSSIKMNLIVEVGLRGELGQVCVAQVCSGVVGLDPIIDHPHSHTHGQVQYTMVCNFCVCVYLVKNGIGWRLHTAEKNYVWDAVK